MKRYYIIPLLILSLCITCSCKDEKNEPKIPIKRTIAIYMIATNSLSSSIASDLAEIETAIQDNGTDYGRVLVYYVSKNEDPQLFEIKQGKNSITRVVHKVYDSSIKSTTVARMREVLTDILTISQTEEYGLLLCSHSSGWANSLTSRSNANIKPLDFGDDYGSTMPIDLLAEAIPDNIFDFIYTDACYMGGIEVAYELRNKTKYYIGSTTEVPADGMDYKDNIPLFLANEVDLFQVCDSTFTKYNKLTGSSRTCTISLIDCAKLDEMAHLCKQIHANDTTISDISDIQKYKYSNPYLFYDFAQYTKLLATDEQQVKFDALMSNLVLYKAATPYIFNKISINPNKYSGLSTYIMGTTQSEGVNETYYKTLSWYKDVIQK